MWRGLSLNDGRLAPALLLGVRHASGARARALLTTSELDGLLGDADGASEAQFEAALGYRREIGPSWAAAIDVSTFQVFARSGRQDPDWHELHFGVDHAAGIQLDLWYTPSLWSRGWQSTAVSLSKQFVLPLGAIADLEAGVQRIESRAPVTYPFARLAVGAPFRDIGTISVEYQVSGGEAQDLFPDDRTGSLLLLRLHFHFGP